MPNLECKLDIKLESLDAKLEVQEVNTQIWFTKFLVKNED